MAITLAVGSSALIAQTQANWPVAGQNVRNTRHQPAEQQISPANASQLDVKWVFDTGGDVSATPTVSDGTVYFPDWAGNLYAVHADTGTLVWQRQISEYDGSANSISRVSPVVDGDQLIIGTNVRQSVAHDGAHVIAVDRATGAFRWMTQVDSHVAAVITGSPVVHGDLVHVGVSSLEEALAANPAYPCCTFRGSSVALDKVTGRIVWQTYTTPDNGGRTDGYSGNAIWSPGAIDAARGVIYRVTGNNYTVPSEVEECQAAQRGRRGRRCDAPGNYLNAILALNLADGAVRWANPRSEYDAWNVACITNPPGPNCPTPAGPDFDFGSGPNLIGNIVGAGQKSGIMWALSTNNGAVVWSTNVAPGGIGGGIQWGTATDGQRFYVASSNSEDKEHTLCCGGPTITWGSWAALDARTGRFIWQIPDPTPGAGDPGPVSVANGVMYAGSQSGHMYAIEAATGRILFSFQSGGSVFGGPAIVDGVVYWGSGYSRFGNIGNNKVYAFAVPAAR